MCPKIGWNITGGVFALDYLDLVINKRVLMKL